MKALDPPSDRFNKSLQNTRYELHINNNDTKTNHFIKIPFPILKEGSAVSQSSFSAGDDHAAPIPWDTTNTNSNQAHPKGLYDYGESILSTTSLVPRASKPDPELIAQAQASHQQHQHKQPRNRSKSPEKRKENPLRAPNISSGLLKLPNQQPPPTQPQGPVSALSLLPPSSTSQMLLSKSTTSLGLGKKNSISSGSGLISPTASGSMYGHGSNSFDQPPISPPKPMRPRLNSVDLLGDVGSDIDAESLARIHSLDSFHDSYNHRHAHNQSLSQIQNQHQNHHHQQQQEPGQVTVGAAFALANENQPLVRPQSSGVQLVNMNKMIQLDEPPTPASNQHQQELTMQMKLAYLSIPHSTSDDSFGARSRPSSRARSAPKTPVSLTTQVLRLPTATATATTPTAAMRELSVFTEHSQEEGLIPEQNGSRLSFSHGGKEGSQTDLKMGSELSTSIANSKAKLSKEKFNHTDHNQSRASSQQIEKKLKSAQLRSGQSLDASNSVSNSQSLSQSQQGGTRYGSPIRPTSPDSPQRQEQSLAYGALKQLSPEQLRALNQPHFQDPRFQQNPRQILYKLRGHVLNPTPYPEEVAHLSLHSKSQPLPQYLRKQLEEQEVNYQNKLRIIAATQPHRLPSPDRIPSAMRRDSMDAQIISRQRGRSEDLSLNAMNVSRPMSGFSPVLAPVMQPASAAALEEAEEVEIQAITETIVSTGGNGDGIVESRTNVDVPITALATAPSPISSPGSKLAFAPETKKLNKGSVINPKGREIPMTDELLSRAGTATSPATLLSESPLPQARLAPPDPSGALPVPVPLSVTKLGAAIEVPDDESVHSGVLGVLSVASHESRTSSPDGSNKRSLSIRISSTGNMYEVGNPSGRGNSPLEPLVIRVGDEEYVDEELLARNSYLSLASHTGQSEEAKLLIQQNQSGRQTPSKFISLSETLKIEDNRKQSRPQQQLHQRQMQVQRPDELLVQGRRPSAKGEMRSRSNSLLGGNNRNSPPTGRGSYLPSRTPPSAVGTNAAGDLGSVFMQKDLDEMSAGNCSAITDDANMSALSFNMPVSPLSAQSPFVRPYPGSQKGASQSTGKYVPLLDSMAGGGSTNATSNAEELMPYQVHRKVMGWKLTSVSRRNNLVGMLDLVNNSRQQRIAAATTISGGGGGKAVLNSLGSPPKQIPHALLRTGHGRQVRTREVPPLNKLTTRLLSALEQQTQIQNTQVMHGFQQADVLREATNNIAAAKLANRKPTAAAAGGSRKTPGKNNALSAAPSASNLAALAIQVESMGKYISENEQNTENDDEVGGDVVGKEERQRIPAEL